MTGIFIVARLGSTRLQQKHLIKVNGKTLIEWLVGRCITAFHGDLLSKKLCIFIVTSEKPENKKFEELFASHPFVRVFYGADANIPFRQLQCAEAYNIKEIINIDGDDILYSTHAAQVVAGCLRNGIECAKTVGLPLGMNVMGYKTSFLRDAVSKHSQTMLETGWGRIFKEEHVKSLDLNASVSDERLRLTLDYPEDALFFTKVIEAYSGDILKADDEDLINFILKNEFYKLNQSLNDTYWQNFELQKKNEG